MVERERDNGGSKAVPGTGTLPLSTDGRLSGIECRLAADQPIGFLDFAYDADVRYLLGVAAGLRARFDSLKPYARHQPECELSDERLGAYLCTCGLDPILRDGDARE